MKQVLYYLLTLLFVLISCKNNTQIKILNNESSIFLEKKIDVLFNRYINENYINESVVDSYNILEIDCININEILNNVYTDDQEVRTTGNKDMYVVDSINRVKVISILEKCNSKLIINKFNNKFYLAIFLTLQHSADKDLMAYYYKVIKKLINKNKLERGILALYVDRFLLLDHKKQIFGTQIKNGKLYKLDLPNSVNKRRKVMKLGNLEEYLLQYNLDFKTEIINLSTK